MKTKLLLITLVLTFAGCSNLDRYDRTYSLQYGEGENAARVGIQLRPTKGYAK